MKAVLTTAIIVFLFILGLGIVSTWPKMTQCADGNVQEHCPVLAQPAQGDQKNSVSQPPQQLQTQQPDVVVDQGSQQSANSTSALSFTYHATGQNVTRELPYNLGTNDVIVGQAYGAAGVSGGCVVFVISGNSQGTTSVTDGEWYEYHGIAPSQVPGLLDQLVTKQRQNYGCERSQELQLH